MKHKQLTSLPLFALTYSWDKFRSRVLSRKNTAVTCVLQSSRSCSSVSAGFVPGLGCRITSSVSPVRRRDDVVVADHGGLGLAGEVAARRLMQGSAAGGSVTRALRRRVGAGIAGYGRLPA